MAEKLGVSVPDLPRVPADIVERTLLLLKAEAWADREKMLRNRS